MTQLHYLSKTKFHFLERQPTIFPVNVLKNRVENRVENTDDLLLNCEAYGTLKPSHTWTLDGKLINATGSLLQFKNLNGTISHISNAMSVKMKVLHDDFGNNERQDFVLVNSEKLFQKGYFTALLQTIKDHLR